MNESEVRQRTAGGTVLVTGGAGYIGSHVVHRLCDVGRAVVVLDDLSTGCAANLPHGIALVEGDVGDSRLLADIFTAHRISTVMHFAGSIVVPESVVDPGHYYANNTAATLTLLRQMVTCKVPHVVFSSTGTVYRAPPPGRQLSEDAPTDPINPYSASKLMSERIIADMTQAHDLSAVILRYFNVAGADPTGRTGQSSPESTHLIKIAAECAVGKCAQIEIFGTDYPTADGTCIRDYIHVDDLVSAHLLALAHLEAGRGSEVFNCGYGRGHSVLQVLDAVERVNQAPLRRVATARRAGDPSALVANANKLRAQLGWVPRHDSLDEIIASAIAWERTLS